MNRFDITQINLLNQAEFVRVIGPVFEHSPWIAEMAWASRPFASVESLLARVCEIVRHSGNERQLLLIRAHPDLVGRLALAGSLTPESNREQSSAGLDVLTPGEVVQFQTNNALYREKFGFPFVICARLNKKEAILSGFRVRLENSRETEIQVALAEIFKIAELRLRDLINPQDDSKT
jgi:OHCU decarboxylase